MKNDCSNHYSYLNRFERLGQPFKWYTQRSIFMWELGTGWYGNSYRCFLRYRAASTFVTRGWSRRAIGSVVWWKPCWLSVLCLMERIPHLYLATLLSINSGTEVMRTLPLRYTRGGMTYMQYASVYCILSCFTSTTVLFPFIYTKKHKTIKINVNV